MLLIVAERAFGGRFLSYIAQCHGHGQRHAGNSKRPGHGSIACGFFLFLFLSFSFSCAGPGTRLEYKRLTRSTSSPAACSRLIVLASTLCTSLHPKPVITRELAKMQATCDMTGTDANNRRNEEIIIWRFLLREIKHCDSPFANRAEVNQVPSAVSPCHHRSSYSRPKSMASSHRDMEIGRWREGDGDMEMDGWRALSSIVKRCQALKAPIQS